MNVEKMRSRDENYFLEEIGLTDDFAEMTIVHGQRTRMLPSCRIRTTIELTARSSSSELNAIGEDNGQTIYHRCAGCGTCYCFVSSVCYCGAAAGCEREEVRRRGNAYHE